MLQRGKVRWDLKTILTSFDNRVFMGDFSRNSFGEQEKAREKIKQTEVKQTMIGG